MRPEGTPSNFDYYTFHEYFHHFRLLPYHTRVISPEHKSKIISFEKREDLVEQLIEAGAKCIYCEKTELGNGNYKSVTIYQVLR